MSLTSQWPRISKFHSQNDTWQCSGRCSLLSRCSDVCRCSDSVWMFVDILRSRGWFSTTIFEEKFNQIPTFKTPQQVYSGVSHILLISGNSTKLEKDLVWTPDNVKVPQTDFDSTLWQNVHKGKQGKRDCKSKKHSTSCRNSVMPFLGKEDKIAPNNEHKNTKIGTIWQGAKQALPHNSNTVKMLYC